MPRTNRRPQLSPKSHSRTATLQHQRIVVKAGTATLSDTSGASGLNVGVLGDLVRQICQLQQMSGEVLLVTSGAIGSRPGN